MLSPASPSYKLAPLDAGLRALSAFSLLAATGPDARVLQAQLMNDVRAIDVGCWQWNGWLNPKGRLLCLFALWRRAEQDFVALLPDFPAAELQPLLQRYVFRSKLALRSMDEFVAAGSGEAPRHGEATARELVQPDGEGWRFDFSGDGGERWLVLRPATEPGLAPAEAGFDARWREFDLAHGLPRLEPGQREAWTPQMLSLQRLHAFSLAKGCYPGQEIVARTHYLGQAKRELARLVGSGLATGTIVETAEGRALGTVVSASADGGHGLAVLQSDRGPGPWRAAAAPVAELPLLGGLQRPV